MFGTTALATEDRVPDHYRAFTAALGAIQSKYAEKVESDRLVYGAINGMLQTLDPHSSFMDPRTYAQMRERQEGRYYGLGVTIQAPNGDITVVRVFEGSPAYGKGIRRGDVIAEIEGEEHQGLDQRPGGRRSCAARRGRSSTSASAARASTTLIPMNVMRDEISIPSLSARLHDRRRRPATSASTTSPSTPTRSSVRALESMPKKGMKRLVLDLRSNPGGQLDQAIRMVNLFVPSGSMIVYTRGRVPNSDQEYRATERRSSSPIPMIMLVNRNSASASEIVSGALQDYDRALDRRRDDVRQGAGAVGVPRQPGRRPGADDGALLHAERPDDPAAVGRRPSTSTSTYTLKDQAERPHTAEQLKYTTGGRKVYSGGGIEPDRRFEGPLEGFNPTPLRPLALQPRQLFARYAEQFTTKATRAPAPGQEPQGT